MPTVETLAAMRAFAESIKGSPFLKPEVRDDLPTLMYLLCLANDIGLPWTTGMRLLYPISRNVQQNGQWVQVFSGVGMEGKAVMALLLSRGFKIDQLTEPTDAEKCTIQLTRPDGTECPAETFSFKQAQDGGFTTNKKDSSIKAPYNLGNRANQLRWRALGRTANFYAADVMQGVYVAEELLDMADHPEIGAAAEPTTSTDLVVVRNKAESPELDKQEPQQEAQAAGAAATEPQPEATTTEKPAATAAPAPPKPTAPATPAPKPAATAAPAPSPAPAAPAASAPPAPASQKMTTEQIQDLYRSIAAQCGDGKEGNRIANNFMKGWFGVEKNAEMPQDSSLFLEPLALLKSMIAEKPDQLLNSNFWGKAARQMPQLTARIDQHKWSDTAKRCVSEIITFYSKQPVELIALFDELALWDKPTADLEAVLRAGVVHIGGIEDIVNVFQQPELSDKSPAWLIASVEEKTGKAIEQLTQEELADACIKTIQAERKQKAGAASEPAKKPAAAPSNSGQEPTQNLGLQFGDE